jgi:hypothetical protein
MQKKKPKKLFTRDSERLKIMLKELATRNEDHKFFKMEELDKFGQKEFAKYDEERQKLSKDHIKEFFGDLEKSDDFLKKTNKPKK